MLRPQNNRIPVTSGPRLLEMADPERVEALLSAPNVRALRYKHTIVELQILDFGDSSRIPPKWGKPQKLSTNLEADDNPRGSWKLKRIFPDKTASVAALVSGATAAVTGKSGSRPSGATAPYCSSSLRDGRNNFRGPGPACPA